MPQPRQVGFARGEIDLGARERIAGVVKLGLQRGRADARRLQLLALARQRAFDNAHEVVEPQPVLLLIGLDVAQAVPGGLYSRLELGKIVHHVLAANQLKRVWLIPVNGAAYCPKLHRLGCPPRQVKLA